MAKKIIEVRTSDLSGVQDDNIETVKLALDGKTYEIELTPGEKDELEAELRPYVSKARRATDSQAPGRKASGSGRSKKELQAARAWLRLRGREVSERGRIQKELLDEWESHGKPGA